MCSRVFLLYTLHYWIGSSATDWLTYRDHFLPLHEPSIIPLSLCTVHLAQACQQSMMIRLRVTDAFLPQSALLAFRWSARRYLSLDLYESGWWMETSEGIYVLLTNATELDVVTSSAGICLNEWCLAWPGALHTLRPTSCALTFGLGQVDLVHLKVCIDQTYCTAWESDASHFSHPACVRNPFNWTDPTRWLDWSGVTGLTEQVDISPITFWEWGESGPFALSHETLSIDTHTLALS